MRSPKERALCHLTKVENKTLLLKTTHMILEYAKRQTESVLEALLLLASFLDWKVAILRAGGELSSTVSLSYRSCDQQPPSQVRKAHWYNTG